MLKYECHATWGYYKDVILRSFSSVATKWPSELTGIIYRTDVNGRHESE